MSGHAIHADGPAQSRAPSPRSSSTTAAAHTDELANVRKKTGKELRGRIATRSEQSAAQNVMTTTRNEGADKRHVNAAVSASSARPCRAMGCPSKVFATDHGSPGILKRIDVIAPPTSSPVNAGEHDDADVVRHGKRQRQKDRHHWRHLVQVDADNDPKHDPEPQRTSMPSCKGSARRRTPASTRKSLPRPSLRARRPPCCRTETATANTITFICVRPARRCGLIFLFSGHFC